MRLFRISCLIGFLGISSVYANQYEYLGNCKFEGYSTIFEQCLDKEYTSYDKELNNLYKVHLKYAGSKQLKKIELLWVKFKEADCEYIAMIVNEGKEFPFIYKVCLINKTKARLADLKRSTLYSEWFDKGDDYR